MLQFVDPMCTPNFPLKLYISDHRLLPLADKVLRQERLDFNDGLLLYSSPDLTGIEAPRLTQSDGTYMAKRLIML